MDGSNHADMALRGLVNEVVELQERRDDVNGDMKEVFARIKDAGYDVPMVRRLVREQRMAPEDRYSFYQKQEEYRGKLGLFADTPLGEATVAREAAYEAANRKHPLPVSGTAEMPTPFAEQPVHAPKRRGRPPKPKTADEALERARAAFSGDTDPLWGPRH